MTLSPNTWYQKYPFCGGKNQSPININEFKTVYDKSLMPIYFDTNFVPNKPNTIWTRKNTGHTIVYALNNETVYTIFNEGNFSLVQMHFHWGHSEHQINGIFYFAELHLVHRSVVDPSKLAVLGFLFQVIKIYFV